MFWWILVCVAVLLIGLSKSGFGTGVGLLIVPMAALGMGHLPGRTEAAALGLLLPLLIMGDVIALWQYRDQFSMQIVKRLLPGTAIGLLIGAGLLWWFHQHERLLGALVSAEIGFESVLLVSMHWWRKYKGVQNRTIPEPARGLTAGVFAGASSTLAHAAGPIIVMYLLPLGLDRRLFVGTTAIYFFLLNSAKVPFYFAAGMFSHTEWQFTLSFAPLVLIGGLAGLWIVKRMSDRIFSQLVLITTFFLGWYLLITGVMKLMGINA